MGGLERGLVERATEARLLMLALVGGEHLLLLGPPGTAKSELCRRLSALGGFSCFELRDDKLFSMAELRQGGFTASLLRGAGFVAADMRSGGFEIAELLDVGYSLLELREVRDADEILILTLAHISAPSSTPCLLREVLRDLYP